MPRSGRVAVPLALLAVTAAAMAPAFVTGSPVGHDSRLHLVWVEEFADSLRAGIPYPRWLPDVNRGLGNPTFVFYPPLVYYLAAAARWIAGSAPRALDLVVAAAALASAAGAYRYLRVGLGRGAALVGASALVLLPYRLLDYYERAAVAEYVAFVWPPLGLLAVRALARAPGWLAAGPAAAALAAVTAALALTHLPSLVLWGPLLAVAIVCHDRRAAGLARGMVALSLGLALAAVFLAPAYAERPLVQLEWLDWVAKAENHTLFAAGMPHESQMIAFNHHVSRLVCWTAALAAVAAAAALWPGGGSAGAEKGRLPIVAATVLAFGVFLLMTRASRPLWATLPVLPSIQFPWRLASLLTPVAALLVAAAAARLRARGAPAPARLLAAAALALLGVTVAVGARQVLGRAYLDSAWAARVAADVYGAQDAGEYRPRTAPAAGFPTLPRAALLAPGGRVSVRRWEPERRVVEVETPTAARLRVRTFMYPGWSAAMDGDTLEAAPLPLVAGYAGAIEADLPPGRHVVRLTFGSTPVRSAGLAVTLLALIAMIVWWTCGWRARP